MSCPLTKREWQCVQGVADGLTYKQIAFREGIGASTVRTHLHSVYAKLGVHDRAQAVLKCQREGWISGLRQEATMVDVLAGDLMYAASQLGEIAGRTPDGDEKASLDVTVRWLNERAGEFPADAITAIPPERT